MAEDRDTILTEESEQHRTSTDSTIGTSMENRESTIFFCTTDNFCSLWALLRNFIQSTAQKGEKKHKNVTMRRPDTREVLQTEFWYDFRKGSHQISASTIFTVFKAKMQINVVNTVNSVPAEF